MNVTIVKEVVNAVIGSGLMLMSLVEERFVVS